MKSGRDSSKPIPIAHFGMVADLHYAERPHGIDEPGQRCFNDAPLKLRDCIDEMNARKVDFLIELGDFKDMMPTKEATLKCLDDIEKRFARWRRTPIPRTIAMQK